MGGGGGSEASKASEELKRKARAERSGTILLVLGVLFYKFL